VTDYLGVDMSKSTQPRSVIPDAAVDKAARVLYEREHGTAVRWGAIPQPMRRRYRSDAREALEAATLRLLAAAWDEGARAQAECYGMEKDTGPNPYRAAS
jgi:hypothetical protein